MRHERAPRVRRGSLLTRKRFQFAGALILGALLPWAARGPLLPGELSEPAALNALFGNAIAVAIAFWMRLSIETYPGIRRSYVIFPSALTGHGLILVWFVLTRFPYDRIVLAAGFALHVAWLYLLYVYAERNIRRRIAVVPYGEIAALGQMDSVDWLTLSRPRLHDARECHAIVADFSADLPDEWEAFLADAALAGRIVYQVKQLSESLTGRVELEYLSENSFGSLLPARGYFYLKAVADFLFALVLLPFALPVMAADRAGHPHRQPRPGAVPPEARRPCRPADHRLQVPHDAGGRAPTSRNAAMTGTTTTASPVSAGPADVAHRRTAADLQHPQWEMSWIGPRPEAEVLSVWYTSEIPFYRYRHVVKPGISGWAQVNQGHVAEVDEVHRKLQYDFYYIKYFSPWLDLLILFRTIKTMLTGYGSRDHRRGFAHRQEHRQNAERDQRDHDPGRGGPAGPLDQPLRGIRRQAAEDRGRHGRSEREAGDPPLARELLGGGDRSDRAIAAGDRGQRDRSGQRLEPRAARHQREHQDRQNRAGDRQDDQNAASPDAVGPGADEWRDRDHHHCGDRRQPQGVALRQRAGRGQERRHIGDPDIISDRAERGDRERAGDSGAVIGDGVRSGRSGMLPAARCRSNSGDSCIVERAMPTLPASAAPTKKGIRQPQSRRLASLSLATVSAETATASKPPTSLAADAEEAISPRLPGLAPSSR